MLDEKYEAYNKIRKSLSKLCPSLVPSPLQGLSLAKLAYMSLETSLAMSDSSSAVVEEVKRFWFSLDRKGVCIVCGSNGNDIDEDWLYFILDKQGKPIDIDSKSITNAQGIAYLGGLRLLCESCHLAKHQGYAPTQGKSAIALEHLANINNLDSRTVRQFVGKAFKKWEKLNQIKDWAIKIDDIGVENFRGDVESILNYMYSKGFSFEKNWLYYKTNIESKRIVEYMNEFTDILDKIKKKRPFDGKVWFEYFKDGVINRLKAKGIRINDEQLKDFILCLLSLYFKGIVIEADDDRISIEKLTEDELRELKPEEISSKLLIKSLIPLGKQSGKWITYVPKDIHGSIFRRIIEALEETELAYHAKILVNPNSNRVPIIVYSPSSFIPRYITDVAKVIKQVLNEYNLIKTSLYYKPDIYTYLNKYPSPKNKASIYI